MLTAMPIMSEFDVYLWGASQHYRSYRKLGAHLCHDGAHFAVWAPNADGVSVMGDFNGWDRGAHPLPHFNSATGIWSGYLEGLKQGSTYKYCVRTRSGALSERCDPYGFWSEMRPGNASRIWDLDRYQWSDGDWMAARRQSEPRSSPLSVYEVHLGSWLRHPANQWLTYREMAERLVDYVASLGSTHVEFLPITEHPYDGSWGYQTTGYFCPSSRFGTPDDLRYLIDRFHQAGIGVILDWVPAHFPRDGHGLAYFDGTHLYEHADPRQGTHAEWDTLIFNYGRSEVKNFLISSALFWLEEYHIDGLRVDAVAAMLYLDYNRKDWVPNRYGGRESLEAIAFLQDLHRAIRRDHPDVFTVAEESTAFPKVTHDPDQGGLGFTFKWNMGWMHDTLDYFQRDPIHRRHHHNKLTFGMLYQYSEQFMLPFSHDEVVHLKKSMLSKMPGDEWQMRANLRALLGYMFGYPGKKLLFMGAEFGQWNEWNEAVGLDWHLLENPAHQGLLRYCKELHRLYRELTALHADYQAENFRWLDCDDADHNWLAFLRHAPGSGEGVLVVGNFSPVPRSLRLQLPWAGRWRLVLNSDATDYGGSGLAPFAGEFLQAESVPHRGQPWSAEVTLPPLGVMMLTASP